MRPEYLELLDRNLWTAWKELAVAFEVSGADMHESFKEFLEEDYFRIVKETCDESARMEAETVATATISFQPMVDLAFGVGSEEASSRRVLLQKASARDHEFAAEAVAAEHRVYLKGVRPDK